MPRPPCCAPVVVLLAATVAIAPVASAQMTPLADHRSVYLRAEFEGIEDFRITRPDVPFAAWNLVDEILIPGSEAGQASATAWQNSTFFPAGIFGAGGCSGEYQVGIGWYTASSNSGITFRLDTCIEYVLDTTIEPGDPGSYGAVLVGPTNGPHVGYHTSGTTQLQGRLSPGDYYVEGWSLVTAPPESKLGPTYSYVFTCQPCAAPLIVSQPRDTTVQSCSGASFTVVPGAGGVTYQWHRNGLPLVNGGNISGANGPTLTIACPAVSDTGYYHVVLVSGPIAEPSRFARLNVTSNTGVAPAASALRFRLEEARPNPSTGSATFHFTAGEPVRGSAAVYDASGRLVQPLAAGTWFGAGTVTWDGRTTTGQRSPAGIYFLRVTVDGATHVRRFVRMR